MKFSAPKPYKKIALCASDIMNLLFGSLGDQRQLFRLFGPLRLEEQGRMDSGRLVGLVSRLHGLTGAQTIQHINTFVSQTS